MAHPRIEEVDDSDISDPSEGDISDFDDADILRAVGPSSSKKPTTSASSTTISLPIRQPPQSQPQSSSQPPPGHLPPAAYAAFQVLYPVYFDSTRTRAQGRRVSRSIATPNPLAAEIALACHRLGLSTVFESGKTHPKDWGNPGRVKVGLKMINTASVEELRKHGLQKLKTDVNNKHHLYTLVAKHLKEHPTTDDSPALREGMGGMGAPPKLEDGKWPRPALPRGVKVGELVPFYSPAMSGGGMEEGMFQDVMKGVMGNMGAMAQGGGAGGGMDMQQMLAAAQQAGQGAGGAGGGGGKKEKKGKGKGKA